MTSEDPRCPDCGGPVSGTDSFCLQCGANLDGRGALATAVVDLGGDRGDDGAADESDPEARADTPVSDAADSVDRDWLHPDSLLDDVSTGAVGVVAGLVVGFLAMVLVLLATGSAIGFLVGPVCWVGASIYVAWTRTAFGAVRKACYLTAPTLVAVPLFWFGDAPAGGNFPGRVVAFVLTEAVAVPLALALAGVGYWAGKRAPE